MRSKGQPLPLHTHGSVTRHPHGHGRAACAAQLCHRVAGRAQRKGRVPRGQQRPGALCAGVLGAQRLRRAQQARERLNLPALRLHLQHQVLQQALLAARVPLGVQRASGLARLPQRLQRLDARRQRLNVGALARLCGVLRALARLVLRLQRSVQALLERPPEGSKVVKDLLGALRHGAARVGDAGQLNEHLNVVS